MWWNLIWKSQSPCLWPKKNASQTSDSCLRLSIEEAYGAFENRLQVEFMMMKISFPRLIAHLKSKSTSPIVFQNHFQNPLPWVKLLRAVGRGRSEDVATISIVEAKRQNNGDFGEQIFKNNIVLVINCSGNIHTSEIIFHFNRDMMVSDRAGKYFLFWKLQGKTNSKS